MSIYELEQSLFVAKYLVEAMNSNQGRLHVDPISLVIVNRVSRLAKLETILLAWSTVRYKELHQIKLPDLLSMRPISIKQYKVNTVRNIPPVAWLDHRIASRLNGAVRVRYLSYDALEDSIQRVLPRDVKANLRKSMTGTHVFRHLRASWFASQGWERTKIMRFFGHKSLETTARYIHPQLFPLYSKSF
jgi:integrase